MRYEINHSRKLLIETWLYNKILTQIALLGIFETGWRKITFGDARPKLPIWKVLTGLPKDIYPQSSIIF